jgi:MFS family permease
MATAEEPLIPLSILRNGVVRSGTASSCFGMGTLVGLTVFLPIFFEEVLGLTAGESGLALIPLTVGVVIGATYAGRGLSHARHYKRLPLAGLVLAAAGCLVLAFFAQDMSLLVVDAILALVSVGMGAMLPVTTVAVQNAVEPHELGTTTAAIGFFRQLGGALLVAVFGAVVLGANALPAPGEGTAALLGAARGDLSARFGWMFVVAAVAFGLAFVMLLMMEERPLKGRQAGPVE